jgi:hypothetical protein
MRIHHSIGEIGMAAIPANVPSRFSIARKAGGLPPVKPLRTPAKPTQKSRKTPAKTPIVNPRKP